MKKMLKSFGIAAVVAVIGFGFASCEGPAGSPGGRGTAGLTPPRSGDGFVVTLGDEDCSLEAGAFFGLFSYDLGNASAAEFNLTSGAARDTFVQGFSRTLTLENNSDYAKFITVSTPFGFDVTLEGSNIIQPVVMEPGDTLEVTFMPTDTILGYPTMRLNTTLIITGEYARGRFERRIDLTFTMGVYADDLEAALHEANIMLLATSVAETGAGIPASAWFVTEAAPRTDLTTAITAAGTALTAARAPLTPDNNATTTNAQNAANDALEDLETAMGTLRGARSAGAETLVPTTALSLTSAASAPVVLADITDAEPFSRNLASGIRTAGNGLLIWEMTWWVYDTYINDWIQQAVPAGIVLSPVGVLTIAHTVTTVGELYVDVFVYGEKERRSSSLIAVRAN